MGQALGCRFVGGSLSFFAKPPILPGTPSPPRILFMAFEPLSTFLRVRSCFVWSAGVRRSTQGAGGGLRGLTPESASFDSLHQADKQLRIKIHDISRPL